MSLLGWLGSTNKVNARSLSPVKKHSDKGPDNEIVLGILGTRSNICSEELDLQLMAPLLEKWGTPNKLILPASGDSSYAIQCWAEAKGIPVSLVCCDWVRNGRKAGLLRDAQIQREATHFLLLQGPRSNAFSALARRLQRKARPVLLSERPGLKADDPL